MLRKSFYTQPSRIGKQIQGRLERVEDLLNIDQNFFISRKNYLETRAVESLKKYSERR